MRGCGAMSAARRPSTDPVLTRFHDSLAPASASRAQSGDL
jgi:hypothetical protein